MRTLPWNLKRFITALFFAVATFAISFVLGNAITTMFGPGTSGFVSIFFTTVMVVVAARITEARGVFTIVVTVFTILAIPTNLFGPPGPHKIIIGFFTGLTYDVVWELMKRKRWSLPVAAFVSTALSLVLVFFLMKYLNHPKLETLQKIILYAIPIYGIMGFFSAWIGNNTIYDKFLQNNGFIKFIKK